MTRRRRHTPDQIIRKLAEGNKLLAGGSRTQRGVPAPGDRRVDLAPLAGPVRRHEGQRRQAAEGARGRERPAEEARGRGRARQGDAQGDGGGKLLTPNRRRCAVKMLRSGSGSPNAEPARSSACTAPPCASAAADPPDDEAELCGPGCGLLHRAAPLGLAPGRQDGPPGGLAGQRQAHPAPVARGGPAGALSQAQEAACVVSVSPWGLMSRFARTSSGRSTSSSTRPRTAAPSRC